MLLIFFLLFILIALGLIVIYSFRYGISPTPSTRKAVKVLLNAIPTNNYHKIVELGAGWGNLAIPIAQKFPQSELIAYEISPIPWFVLKSIQICLNLKHLQVIRKDFFQDSLHDADVIICYLYPGAMRKLKVKFEQELKPGTWVLSNTFAIPGWIPERIYRLDDLYKTPIYVYRSV